MYISKLWSIVLILVVSHYTFTMEQSLSQRVDSNGYRYKDEDTVQDKRKIAILSYGSLVHQPINERTGAQLYASSFQPTALSLPVAMARESAGKRISAVVDTLCGKDKRVWYAVSEFAFLPNARNNLAAREGVLLRNGHGGYDLTNIFYIKKILPGRTKEADEEVIPDTTQWVIRTTDNVRQRIPTVTAQSIASWAEKNRFSAVIWASFPATLSSQKDVARTLLSDPELLRNTQGYVQMLPDRAQTVLERAICAGPEALSIIAQIGQSPSTKVVREALQNAVNDENKAQIERQALLLDCINEAPHVPALQQRDFMVVQEGTIPLILTAPHGGTLKIPGVPVRRHGEHCLDGNTLELTLAVSDELFRLFGVRPYVVAARFGREYIDANRAPREAYEHRKAEPVYEAYHGQIKQFIDAIKARYGSKALLLDIHAHGLAYDVIYRGTQNRKTVNALVHRCGEISFTGPKSILGLLAEQDHKVFPLNNQRSQKEHGSYNGGYTVRNYGSHRENGIDALQLEFGWNFRDPRNIPTFAQDFAKAIMTFCTTYLS